MIPEMALKLDALSDLTLGRFSRSCRFSDDQQRWRECPSYSKRQFYMRLKKVSGRQVQVCVKFAVFVRRFNGVHILKGEFFSSYEHSPSEGLSGCLTLLLLKV